MDIKLRKAEFKVDVGENIEAWNYINSGLWEPYSFNIFDAFTTDNDTILDIGSWSGVLSLYAANTVRKVYALDPDPVCFKELEINIKLNSNLANKIAAHNIAISGKKETVYLHAREAYGKSSSSILRRKRDNIKSLEIKTTTLLSFLEQEKIDYVNFIKMDVEGAEFKILPSIKNALVKMNYPSLYISFHYDYLNEHLYSKYINSKLLTKLFLKFEKGTGLSVFKNKIKRQINHLFDDLLDYKYIYTSQGKLIENMYLKHHPECIKNYDLVFTNKKWE